MKLTRNERWILSNQFRILEALYPNEADEFRETREVVERGYELHYRWIADFVLDDESVMSEAECEEILDILGMFDAIYRSAKAEKPKADEWHTTFRGFDGNNEPKELAYASFFCRSDGGRFKEIVPDEVPNSHSPSIDTYRRQLSAWRESKDKNNLSKADIERIAAAAIHPDHRPPPGTKSS